LGTHAAGQQVPSLLDCDGMQVNGGGGGSQAPLFRLATAPGGQGVLGLSLPVGMPGICVMAGGLHCPVLGSAVVPGGQHVPVTLTTDPGGQHCRAGQAMP
jgi:hypothetical protein